MDKKPDVTYSANIENKFSEVISRKVESMTKITVVTELSDALTESDVEKLKGAIEAPEGIFEEISDPTDFLIELLNWKNHNSFKFDSALQRVRPDLLVKARLLPWLSCPTTGDTCAEREISMKSFVFFLKTEPSSKSWKRLLLNYQYGMKKLDFVKIFKFCLNSKIIRKDLRELKIALQGVKRDDLALKLEPYQQLFSIMTDFEFEKNFKSEYQKSKTGDPIVWKAELQKYSAEKFSKVQPVLGSKVSVSLKSEFIPLTIVNQSATGEEEGTERELEMLEKFYKQESIPNIDFIQKISEYAPYHTYVLEYNLRKEVPLIHVNLEYNRKGISIPKHYNPIPKSGLENEVTGFKKDSWCLIGNPGSGKTFLCSRIALLYGHNELSQFEFSLSIPCRNKEWHHLESNRFEQKAPFSKQLIQQWLRLGMPEGQDWTKDLADHIVKTEGRGVLLIIDSIDEFTKSVPIDQTLLCFLLRRGCLTNATMLFTSRPGAWFDTESTISNIKISVHYKVLGFSPENRDLYVTTQLPEENCKACFELFYYYHEIRLLCLVPVNASLIVSLFKSSSSINIQSLTELYSYLTLHLIMRQLSRMGLEEYTNALQLLHLNKGVLACLRAIGEVAYKGVALREMTSSTKFLLRIVGEGVRDSEWLGLVNVSIKSQSDGVKTKIWSFSHLTLQEFIGAIWLHGNPWYDACLIVRFTVASYETFSLFRMVIRFLCGLLAETSLPILYIIFKHLIVTPLPYSNMPLCQQYRYEENDILFKYSDCIHFTNQFLSISSFLVETNSPFLQVVHLLPKDISFYIDSVIAPNEWLSFIKSLRFLNSIHLIYFNSNHINATDFKSLLENVRDCTLVHLAIKFSKKTYSDIHPYVEVIKHSHLTSKTNISFDIEKFSMPHTQPPIHMFSISPSQNISSVRLFNNDMSTNALLQLKDQIESIKSFYLYPEYARDFPALLSIVLSNTRLQGLHLYDIPNHIFNNIPPALSNLSKLQELSCNGPDAYNAIVHRLLAAPNIRESDDFDMQQQRPNSNRSQLTYLSINLIEMFESEKLDKHPLLQLLEENRSYLITLIFQDLFYNLDNVNNLFMSLQKCTALVSVKLENFKSVIFASINSVTKLKLPQSLICLEIKRVALYHSGLLFIIQTIVFHKALRYLKIFECELTDHSCLTLCNLISTLRQLRALCVNQRELSTSNKRQFELLKQSAVQFSIDLLTQD